MTVDERDRHMLHRRLEETLGAGPADTLMSYLPPVGWADVATKRDLEQLADRFDAALHRELHREVGGLRSELHAELGDLRSELHTEIGGLRKEFATQSRTLLFSAGMLFVGMASLLLRAFELV